MLAILDYDAGNIESVRLALRHVGGDPVFVRDAAAAKGAERIVFPGVGSARQCMANLQSRGFDTLLRQAMAAQTPILAICIGMQLLFDSSAEDDGVAALGLLPGKIIRFRPHDPRIKVPHMGWNQVAVSRSHPLMPENLTRESFYFVHSYYVQPAWSDAAVTHSEDAQKREAGSVHGITQYAGVRFASMVSKGSLFAAQFHPEKSGEIGLNLLRRFLQWNGQAC